VPFRVKVRVNITIDVGGAAGESHGSFVGSRPLSRAAPLPQDDNAIKAGSSPGLRLVRNDIALFLSCCVYASVSYLWG
jgi:hypothetical protein